MNAFGYIGAMSAGILWSCLHATHYTRWLRASRINEGFSDLELSFEFYDGFFFFSKAQHTVRVTWVRLSWNVRQMNPRASLCIM